MQSDQLNVGKDAGSGAAQKVGSSIADKLAIGFAVITVIMTVTSTVMTILEAADFYDTEYIPIPKYMVDEADITACNDRGEQIMIKNQTAYYKVGIHEFGGKAAANLNNKHYLFPDNPPSIKVFFKNEKKTVEQLTGTESAEKPAGTASIFAPGSLAIGGGVGLVAGAFLGMVVSGRRKKKTAGTGNA